MTFEVGDRVRVLESGEHGKVVAVRKYGEFEVEIHGLPWNNDYLENELIFVPDEPEIVRSLVFGGNGGLVWSEETYNSSIPIAYGWSDGVMTWQRWRD